jgi:hypothetical protein
MMTIFLRGENPLPQKKNRNCRRNDVRHFELLANISLGKVGGAIDMFALFQETLNTLIETQDVTVSSNS